MFGLATPMVRKGRGSEAAGPRLNRRKPVEEINGQTNRNAGPAEQTS
jgi:hypothetical protein